MTAIDDIIRKAIEVRKDPKLNFTAEKAKRARTVLEQYSTSIREMVRLQREVLQLLGPAGQEALSDLAVQVAMDEWPPPEAGL